MDGRQKYPSQRQQVASPAEIEQMAEIKRMTEVIMDAIQEDITAIARLMVSKDNSQLLGKTEFELRDLVHQAGAHALAAVLEDRKKGGTKAAV